MDEKNTYNFMNSFRKNLSRPLAVLTAASFLASAKPSYSFKDFNQVPGDSTGVYTLTEPGDLGSYLGKKVGLAMKYSSNFWINVVNDQDVYLPQLGSYLGYSGEQVDSILRRYHIDDIVNGGISGRDGIPGDRLMPGDPIVVSYSRLEDYGISASAFRQIPTAQEVTLEERVTEPETKEEQPVKKKGVVMPYKDFMEAVIGRLNTIDSRITNIEKTKKSWISRHPRLSAFGVIFTGALAGYIASELNEEDEEEQQTTGVSIEIGGDGIQ